MNFILFVYVILITLKIAIHDKINDFTFSNMTDRDKFVYLMKKTHWKQLSQYIETAWNYRNSILYKQCN